MIVHNEVSEVLFGRNDLFHRVVTAYAIPRLEAVTVGDVINKRIKYCFFGVRLDVHSDYGRNFEREL